MEYFHEWRTADRVARAAEKAVFAASMCFLDGLGSGPTDEQVEHAHHLRATADDLFNIAMQEMTEISNSLKCR
jgi:hypothetical protein